MGLPFRTKLQAFIQEALLSIIDFDLKNQGLF